MKRTYIYVDGEMVEKPSSIRRNYHYVIQDEMKPYKSMIDGRTINSRTQHKRHLRENKCIEIGNEEFVPKHETKLVKSQRKEILRDQLFNMTDSDANKILNQMRDHLRFTNYNRR
jgi:hypothetical protein